MMVLGQCRAVLVQEPRGTSLCRLAGAPRSALCPLGTGVCAVTPPVIRMQPPPSAPHSPLDDGGLGVSKAEGGGVPGGHQGGRAGEQ